MTVDRAWAEAAALRPYRPVAKELTVGIAFSVARGLAPLAVLVAGARSRRLSRCADEQLATKGPVQ